MALTDCATRQEGVPLRAVTKNTEAQAWLKASGLNQKQLAELLDATENTISRQMKGESPLAGYVVAFVEAWKLLDDRKQAILRQAIAAELRKREKTKP